MRDSLLVGGKAGGYSSRIRAVAQAPQRAVQQAVRQGRISQGEATAGAALRRGRTPQQVRAQSRAQFDLGSL